MCIYTFLIDVVAYYFLCSCHVRWLLWCLMLSCSDPLKSRILPKELVPAKGCWNIDIGCGSHPTDWQLPLKVFVESHAKHVIPVVTVTGRGLHPIDHETLMKHRNDKKISRFLLFPECFCRFLQAPKNKRSVIWRNIMYWNWVVVSCLEVAWLIGFLTFWSIYRMLP